MSPSITSTRRLKAIALLGGGLAAGVIGATAIGATARDATSVAPTAATSTAGVPQHTGRSDNGETTVTGTKAARLKAAALKKVPGGTVERVSTETDTSGAAYEVHVRKADGTRVTVLFDASLAYVSMHTDADHGDGHGHGPGGGRGDETAVTGTKAATLRAAAIKQVPGAAVDEITSDSGDAAYEVHLTKSDGTHVTAKFDKNLTFVKVEDGRGK